MNKDRINHLIAIHLMGWTPYYEPHIGVQGSIRWMTDKGGKRARIPNWYDGADFVNLFLMAAEYVPKSIEITPSSSSELCETVLKLLRIWEFPDDYQI